MTSTTSSCDCSEEGIIYFAGYLAFKFRKDYPQLGSPTAWLPTPELSPWLESLSRGGLCQPSNSFIAQVKKMEKIFNKMHGSDLLNISFVTQTLFTLLCDAVPDVPIPVLKKYSSTRTFIRLKYINRKAKDNNEDKRRSRREAKKLKQHAN